MKISSLLLLSMAIMPSYLCFGQDQEIEVHLSSVDKYVKMELTNHTHEDLYIPHIRSFFTIWDKNGVEIKARYCQLLYGVSSIFFGSAPYIGPLATEFIDDNYHIQDGIYFVEALKKEKESFLKLNPSITEEMISKEYKISFDKMEQSFAVYNKKSTISLPRGAYLSIFEAERRIYSEELLKKEKGSSLNSNRLITKKMIHKEYKISLGKFLEFLYMAQKYDGVAIKAGQTLNIFQPIFGLFEDNGGNPRESFTIRFTRHNDWEYSVFDTVSTEEGHQVYTRLPQMNAGYRLYDGAIECDDVITLNP